MNDDRLGDMLRGEIPEPADGYWDKIDAGLHGDADSEDGDIDDDVVRQMAMPSPQPSSAGRWLVTAAALLLPLAGGAWLLSQSVKSANGETIAAPAAQDQQVRTQGSEPTQAVGEGAPTDPEPTRPPPQPAPSFFPNDESDGDNPVQPDSEADAKVEPPRQIFSPGPGIVGPRCYQGAEISEGLALRLTVEASGLASAVSYTDVNGTIFVDHAAGFLLADDTLAMLVSPIGSDRARYSTLWYVSSEAVSLSEDVSASSVDCVAIADQLTAAEAAIDAAPVVDQTTIAPVLSPGRHCFVDSESHPGADYVRIDIDEAGDVTAETRSFLRPQPDPQQQTITAADGVVEMAAGLSLTDAEILVRVVLLSGDQTNERLEFWKVIDDGDTLQMSQFQFENRRVDCAEIDGFFAAE